jgi:protein dithiol:quinone oxidoreductase
MSLLRISTGTALLAIAAMSLGAVALALVTQHAFDMQPCPWCVLQRLEFVVIGGVALLALVSRSERALRAATVGVVALSGLGIATALWHYFVAAASTSCDRTLADRIIAATGLDGLLPAVFEARVSCAEASVTLLGLPYVFWSFAVFSVLEATALWLLMRNPVSAGWR